jgi:hypothetical protein
VPSGLRPKSGDWWLLPEMRRYPQFRRSVLQRMRRTATAIIPPGTSRRPGQLSHDRLDSAKAPPRYQNEAPGILEVPGAFLIAV